MNEYTRTIINRLLKWETFWFLSIICSAMIDQLTTFTKENSFVSAGLLYRAFIGMIYVFFIIRHIKATIPDKQYQVFTMVTIFMGLIVFLSALRSQSIIDGLLYFAKIAWWLIMLNATILFIRINTARINLLVNALFFSAIIILISLATSYFIIGNYRSSPSDYQQVEAVYGLFYSGKGVAESLTILLPFIWIKTTGLIKYILSFFLILVVILTFSRTALLSGICALALLSLFTGYRSSFKIKVLYFLKISSLFVIFIYFIILIVGQDRILQRWQRDQLESGSGRNIFWSIALKSWIDADIINQIFGYGMNGSMDIIEKNYGPRIWCHNDCLELLINSGLTGLFIYIIFIIILMKFLFSSHNKGASYSLIVSYLICSFLSGTIYQLDFMTYFCTGFSCLAVKSKQYL